MFADRKEAESWQEQQRTLRINEGLSGVNIPEALRIEAMECQRRLTPHGVTLTAAVNYFLKHAKPTGGVKLLTDHQKDRGRMALHRPALRGDARPLVGKAQEGLTLPVVKSAS